MYYFAKFYHAMKYIAAMFSKPYIKDESKNQLSFRCCKDTSILVSFVLSK